MLLGDIEIKLLRARLEQTEKTLQTVLAQMATINNPLNKPKLNGKKVKNESYKKMHKSTSLTVPCKKIAISMNVQGDSKRVLQVQVFIKLLFIEV